MKSLFNIHLFIASKSCKTLKLRRLPGFCNWRFSAIKQNCFCFDVLAVLRKSDGLAVTDWFGSSSHWLKLSFVAGWKPTLVFIQRMNHRPRPDRQSEGVHAAGLWILNVLNAMRLFFVV